MTFYEAALRVLEAAGHPLHFHEITERSIQQNLLSHIGKTPELTMLSRLLAMARRKTDRKVVVTTKDTFALADWALPEEPDALAQTALSENREEDNLPPLRPAERHPEPRSENVRVAGRGVERKRRRDEEDDGKRRKKKFPPVPEVVFEILSDEGTGLSARALVERARERGLASDELREEQVLTALLEDNQRRIDAGRRPQFLYEKEGSLIALERAGAPSPMSPQELQAAFAAAVGVPMEAGRPVLPQKGALSPEAAKELGEAQAALKTAVKTARRATASALRKRLSELDGGTFEKAVVKLLHAEGFRELKVAKRSRDAQVLTARKKEGSLELRFAIRVLHSGAQIDRKAIQEARKDASHHSTNVSLLVTSGELRGDSRGEAVSGGSLVFVWAGDALADRFLDEGLGVTVTQLPVFELDERFFETARVDAEESARRREERQKDKKRDDRRDRPPRAEKEPREAQGADEESEEGAEKEEAPRERARDRDRDRERNREDRPSSMTVEASPEPLSERPVGLAADAGDEDDEGEDDEGDDEEGSRAESEGGAPGAAGSAGERKRRRRRRRGRRGRGNKPNEGGAEASEGNGNGGPAPAAAPAAPTAPASSAESEAPAAAPGPAEETKVTEAAEVSDSTEAQPPRVAAAEPPPSEAAAQTPPPPAEGAGEDGAAS